MLIFNSETGVSLLRHYHGFSLMARPMVFRKKIQYLLFFFIIIKWFFSCSHIHSTIDIEKDKSKTELLIFMIIQFSAKYRIVQLQGRKYSQE